MAERGEAFTATLQPLIGVLGGMGPLAAADFLRKWACLTPAGRDQEHPCFIAYSDPRTPDRSAAILGYGESPLPRLRQGLQFLERSGAAAIVIPCNTAHHWLDDMRAAVAVPILSIFDAVAREITAGERAPAKVGILGTAGTLRAGLYQRDLAARGFGVVEPGEEMMSGAVEPAIRAIKAGIFADAAALVGRAIADLRARGAGAVVLGCTELPLALEHGPRPDFGVPIVDSTGALASLTVAWLERHQSGGVVRQLAPQGTAAREESLEAIDVQAAPL